MDAISSFFFASFHQSHGKAWMCDAIAVAVIGDCEKDEEEEQPNQKGSEK